MMIADRKKISYNLAWQNTWRNIKINGGLQLTPEGHVSLSTDLELEFFVFDLEIKPGDSKFLQLLLTFDRHLDAPFYIMKKSLIVYSEKQAMFLGLYKDNWDLFIEAHK